MTILLAADIFGNSPTQIQIYKHLKQHFDVISVCPYEDNHPIFNDDQTAYDSFVAEGGMAAYIDKIKNLSDIHKVEMAIGFSAGAAALWASQHEISQLKTGILFYPGQIRHYLDINPYCPWQIVFAKNEVHFDQKTVINVLNKNNDVEIACANNQHGFINSQSSNYKKEDSELLINLLFDYLIGNKTDNFCNMLPNSYQKFGKVSHTD